MVSQFTLYARIKKGNRPSFNKFGDPIFTEAMYGGFIDVLSELINMKVQTGEFGKNMQVELLNY